MLPMELPPRPIALSRSSSSGAIPRQPPLASDCKNKRGESAKNRFVLDLHSAFLGDAARRQVIRMNKRNHARQCQIAKSMIPHGLRCFSRKSATPIIGTKPVPNFDFVRLIDLLMKDTAIADQPIIVAMNDCKLRWQPATLPVNEFVQKDSGLFPCKNTKRKPHEIRVRHERREKIDIFLAKET